VDIVRTVNVLGAAKLVDPSPVVLFASSNQVYGKRKDTLKEDDLLEPEGPYGLSKMCAEKFCRMYASCYGLDIPMTRCHHVIGMVHSDHQNLYGKQ
jgi:nucleoside-diphosphate-sugar epimerase